MKLFGVRHHVIDMSKPTNSCFQIPHEFTNKHVKHAIFGYNSSGEETERNSESEKGVDQVL